MDIELCPIIALFIILSDVVDVLTYITDLKIVTFFSVVSSDNVLKLILHF